MASSEQKVWFITGCGTGFGKLLTREALKRGDKVISTGRGDLSRLDDLKEAGAHVMECDVTAPHEEMKEVAKKALAVYGRIDVLFNNAGYGLLGTIEELGPDKLLEQYKVNVFGLSNVTTAFLPHFRERRSGTIVVTGSRSGVRVMPGLSAYGTSKAAANSFGEHLAAELTPFNIRVLTVIPGGFFTEGTTGIPSAPECTIPDYQPLHDAFAKIIKTLPGTQLGSPSKYAEIVVDVIRGEGIMRDEKREGGVRPWPERLPLGSDAVLDARKTFKSWEATFTEWMDVISSTDLKPFDPVPQ